MTIKPYSNDYMTYNEITGRYVLTAKAVLDTFGIDLSGAVKDNPNGVSGLLNRISVLTYKKIHEHNTDNALQDSMIAYSEGGRKIIYDAMLEQFLYVKTNGDLSMSVEASKRALWFSDTAYEILLQPIPEFGQSVCYTGVL